MAALIARRLAAMAFTLLAVSFLVFLVMESNIQSVAIRVLGAFSTAEQRQIWLEQHGYLQPFLVRYGRWLANMIAGDFGWSTRFKIPVADILWPRLGYTAILAACTFLIMVPLGLLAGILAGMRPGSVLDRVISTVSITMTSIPEFALAIILLVVLVFWLGWLPGTSNMSRGFDPVQLVLPVATLVLFDFGYIARLTRASMAEVVASSYVRTAILKGLSRRRVVLTHALPNALMAPFTAILLQINWLISGVVVVEVAFGYPGFGSLLLQGALNQDLYVVEACAMISVIVAISTQALSDLGYVLLNPRIRLGGRA